MWAAEQSTVLLNRSFAPSRISLETPPAVAQHPLVRLSAQRIVPQRPRPLDCNLLLPLTTTQSLMPTLIQALTLPPKLARSQTGLPHEAGPQGCCASRAMLGFFLHKNKSSGCFPLLMITAAWRTAAMHAACSEKFQNGEKGSSLI